MTIYRNLHFRTLPNISRRRYAFANDRQAKGFVKRICITQNISGIGLVNFTIEHFMIRHRTLHFSNGTALALGVRKVRGLHLRFAIERTATSLSGAIERHQFAIIGIDCSQGIACVLRGM